MGFRALAHPVALPAALLAAALVLALPQAALAAPLSGSSFDTGDGNQENGLNLDWQNGASTGRAVENPDPNSADSCYIGGVKENTPNKWAFNTSAGGCTPGKSNVRAAWANPESTGATTFAHFAFWRNDTTGNSFLTFELNQSAATWVNAAGTTIPCRNNGDLLLSFESAGGSALATGVYKWIGDGAGPAACPNGASGSFTSSGLIGGTNFQGSMNPASTFNYLNPGTYGSSFPSNSFGEAAINLPTVLQGMGENPCFGFLQMQVHSRSSSSISSALIDTTTPVPVYLQSCSATGYKYQDDNGNGTRDAGEQGLPGFVFYLDLDDDGVKDAGEPSGTSDSNGFYRILNVPAGTYKIREVDQDGWSCTGPSPCSYTRSFTTGGNSTGNDFGNSGPSTASGTKFDDLNANGLQDAGEPGRAGFAFYADYDDDGVKDAGEPGATSDAAGVWAITNVEAGTYKVREVAQAGWTCSLPSPCYYTRSFTSGSSAAGLTFGNWNAASISGNLFEDLDGDGAAKESGEPNLSGWQVYVDANANDAFDFGETAATTDASGNYTLSAVQPGSRTVRATPPSSSWYCTRPSQTSSACERSVTIVSGQAATEQDFGFTRYATVSGTKFDDANNNGVKDGSESGVAGFVFYVDYDNDDVLDAGEPQGTSAATTGAWSITGVKAGSYPVREVPQAGWTCTKPATTCRYDLTITSAGSNTGNEFGNYIVRSVSGAVFRDNDADGLAREAGEGGLEGWTVYDDANTNSVRDAGEAFDVTNADGFYILTGLANGAYRLRVVSQAGWTCSFPAGCLNTGSLGNSANASDSGKDFGLWGPASISGNMFEDADADGLAKEAGESDLSGRTVYIDADSDGSLDAGEPSATTNVSGDYTISSVSPGTYTVRQVLPGGWTCSRPAPCSYSVTISGANVTDKNFGSWTTGAVGGSLYEDRDANGSKDAGEGSLAGRTVYLDLSGNGAKDAGEPETTTDGSGNYSFTRAPGSYRVRVADAAGWTCSQPSPCDYEITVTSQSSATSRDFGLYTTGAINGSVYEDSNFDKSVPDAGEPALSGETVYIDANENGTLDVGETQTTTDGSGVYAFTGLEPGAYVVRLSPKAGWTCSFPGGCRQEVAVLSQTTEAAGDFGTYLGAEVSGNVFEDLDADGAPREAGEGSLDGERVYLDGDLDGVRDAGEPTTLTDAAGNYELSGIEVQTWHVRVELGAEWNCDSPSPCHFPVVLSSGGSETGLDFGAHAPGSISGHLYTDRDNDQEPQEFGENDQPGRTVYADTNDDGDKDVGEPAATTDGDGRYTISDLAPGTHRVRQELPSGWTCSTPSPCSWLVTITSRDAATEKDFSSWTKASFSGRQFEDLDGDGAFPEDGEPGLSGRTVYIDTDDDGVKDAGEPETTTGVGGSYSFSDVDPGTHVVRATAPPTDWDSSYPADEAWTITLEANEAAQEIDFGSHTTGALSGQKFEDLDGDGVKDAGEDGLSGWAIYADTDDDGAHDAGEPVVTTGAGGSYDLTLDPGTHTIREVQQSGWTCSLPSPCSYTVEVESSGSYGARDFGNWEESTATGSKFNDLDNDGTKDAAEGGLSGWTFYADYDDDAQKDVGEPQATSDAGGDWLISGIEPGAYKVREVGQAGWKCTAPDPCHYSRTFSSGSEAAALQFGNTNAASISGSLFEDLDGDGTQEPGEGALSGAVVWLDADDDGTKDAGEAEQTTDGSGNYTFNTTAGSHVVRALAAAGWSCSSPSPCRYGVTVDAGDSSTGNDFGLWTVGTVSGQKFEDLDADGVKDAGDGGVSGWTIYADVDGDGEHDAGEPSTTTDGDGEYSLALDPGTYVILEVNQSGWTCSLPSPCSYTVGVESSGSYGGRDFGGWRQGTITGTVFEDLDGDGSGREAGEPPIEGRTVYIDSNDDGIKDAGEPDATSDAAGDYSFDVEPGTYDVRVVAPAGWTSSHPASKHQVTVDSSETESGKDFGLWTVGTVAGTNFEDADRNGARNSGEGTLVGGTFYLDANENGRRDSGEPADAAGAGGEFAFSGLTPGHYTLRQAVPSGWNCSAPADCSYEFTLVSNQSLGGRDFGNWREPDPEPDPPAEPEPEPGPLTIGPPDLHPEPGTGGGDDPTIGRKTDPDTGEEIYLVPNTDECLPLRLDVPIDAEPGAISDVRLVLHAVEGDDDTITLIDTPPEPADGVWSGTIPCARNGELELVVTTPGGEIRQPIGEIVLIDPSGTVYDEALYEGVAGDGASPEAARCASAIPGATVTLERRVDGRFQAVAPGDSGIAPNVNPQETDADGTYRWDVAEGRYRVRVTKDGYYAVVSRAVSVPPPVLDLHVAMERRPGTPAPRPRDCGEPPKPVIEAQDSCLMRPVNARVRGRAIRKVVFYLDGRVVKTVSRSDARGRFGVTVQRKALGRGRHVLRAKVIFVHRAKRRPEFLKMAIKRCVDGSPPKVVSASPRPGCGTRPFLAWVRGDRIRKVAFRLDGRRMKTVSVADWRGRYGATIDPTGLRNGSHVVLARIEFLKRSGLRTRTVRLEFTKCR